MRCPICETVDQWENVDHLKLKKTGLHICTNCGFMTYPDIASDKEKLKEYYRKDYRQAPNAANFYAGQRKIQFHQAFLHDFWPEFNKREDRVIAEVGGAFGMFLDYVRNYSPKAKEIYGTELTTSFRRVGKHFFGIDLYEELKEQKHDLICSYKVLEHQIDPDKELLRYRDLIKDDGYLYLGIPIWFEAAALFGSDGFHPEEYFHKNHINTWTERHVRGLLKKTGWDIIKHNDTYYDHVFLLKKKNTSVGCYYRESPDEIKKQMKSMFKAWQAIDQRDFNEAINLYPKYPNAWMGKYEMERNKAHELGYEKIIETYVKPQIELMPKRAEPYFMWSDIACRYEHYQDAIDALKKILEELKPNNPMALLNYASVLRNIAEKEPQQAPKFFQQAAGVMKHLDLVSLQSKTDVLNWSFHDLSNIPIPSELGETESKPSQG